MKSLRNRAQGESHWATRPLEDELGEALRAELLGWPEMKLRPMMGTLAYFRGKRFLGCYVNRALIRTRPAWANRADEPPYVCVRLRDDDAARALRRPEIRRARLEFVGWVEIPLASRKLLEEAVRWFGRAYEAPRGAAARRKIRRKRAAGRGREKRS
jgi:hypothetical protein